MLRPKNNTQYWNLMTDPKKKKKRGEERPLSPQFGYFICEKHSNFTKYNLCALNLLPLKAKNLHLNQPILNLIHAY